MVVECRGKKEDADLELSFRRTAQGANAHGFSLPFEIVFADKKTNSTGLQLADLVSPRSDGTISIQPSPTKLMASWSPSSYAARPGR